MKRIFAFLLAAIMLCATLTGCKVYYSLFGINENYTGPTMYAYLCDAPSTFDPMYAYLDDSATFVMSLIYEGLFKYDEHGKAVFGLAKSYKKTLWNETTGEFQIEITIKDTMWNDQTAVSADQFVYAWRRILDPSTSSSAAVLLYDIKNARKVANAEDFLTKFDFGATAVGTNILRIDFETYQLENGKYKVPDLDAFLAKLASPVLVPMRSDMVAKLDDWASTNATVPACGPFYLKSFTPGDKSMGVMRFERNRYYLRDQKLDPIDKYVKPYQIEVSLADRDGWFDEEEKKVKWDPDSVRESPAVRALEKFNTGKIDYLSYIPLKDRAEYADLKTNDTLFTHTYFFNTENPLFADAKVRQALSLAIDRQAIAEAIVYASPASTIVSDKTPEAGCYVKKGTTFNSNSGEKTYTSATADMELAKELLKGVTKGSFAITVKDGDEVSLKVAEICRDAWNALGYKVSIRKLGIYAYQQNDYDGRMDLFNQCLLANGQDRIVDMKNKGGFEYSELEIKNNPKLKDLKNQMLIEGYDVIAVDFYQNSLDAFTVLAPFSKYFSGGSIDLSTSQEDEYVPVLPMTSYDSDRYNTLMETAFRAASREERAAALHEAEALLMEDLPVMPIFTYNYPVRMVSKFVKVDYGYGGEPIFTDMRDRTYKAAK